MRSRVRRTSIITFEHVVVTGWHHQHSTCYANTRKKSYGESQFIGYDRNRWCNVVVCIESEILLCATDALSVFHLVAYCVINKFKL